MFSKFALQIHKLILDIEHDWGKFKFYMGKGKESPAVDYKPILGEKVAMMVSLTRGAQKSSLLVNWKLFMAPSNTKLTKGTFTLGLVALYCAEAWLCPLPSPPCPALTLLQSNWDWAHLSYLILGVWPVFSNIEPSFFSSCDDIVQLFSDISSQRQIFDRCFHCSLFGLCMLLSG